MGSFPDFSDHNYEIVRELGQNLAGGRVTYQAIHTQTQQLVVIKQFQFAQSSSDWSGFKAYEREITVLKSLDYPGIPCYLGAFETQNGFCMVQEYIQAEPLNTKRLWKLAEIQQVAIALLKILKYLQESFAQPIIHRDIKPENILIDSNHQVYLIDFGLARIGGNEIALSSVAAGTFGFMSPEQLYNRNLTKATDLYGLGVTLACLLTGTKSTSVETLVSDEGRIAFRHLLQGKPTAFLGWLEKMVQHRAKDRFIDAAAALEALEAIVAGKSTPDLIPQPKGKIARRVEDALFLAAKKEVEERLLALSKAKEKRISAGVCALFLGCFGVHKFLLGYKMEGGIMLAITIFSFGFGSMVMTVVGWVEGVRYLKTSDQDFLENYVLRKKGWF